jgi:hypothetical protein
MREVILNKIKCKSMYHLYPHPRISHPTAVRTCIFQTTGTDGAKDSVNMDTSSAAGDDSNKWMGIIARLAVLPVVSSLFLLWTTVLPF